MGINKEGYGIIRNTGIASAVIITLMAILGISGAMSQWVAVAVIVAMLAALAFVVMFFRQPQRPLLSEPGTVFAPADGKIVAIQKTFEKEYMERECILVSVFMSITNVHSNSYPVSGRIVYFRYHPGKFLVAWHPKSSECNERTTTVVNTGRHDILMRQIAGLVARRIVSYAVVGEEAVQNHKFGFIKFGSRVDVMLPPDSEIAVNVGDKVKGGITPLARLS